jgi:C4-dicarboxylate-specific signal transduction histidine kinase
VTATLALAANELDARGAQVHSDLSPGRLKVRGNGPQLQQIVLNLAFNAAEAMADLPEAARIVRVSTARRPDGSSTLAVADAGPGVPADRRAEIFRPFVTSKSTGLGVGLAICRSIAEAHGGSLEFTDPETRGARILLSLPRAEALA